MRLFFRLISPPAYRAPVGARRLCRTDHRILQTRDFRLRDLAAGIGIGYRPKILAVGFSDAQFQVAECREISGRFFVFHDVSRLRGKATSFAQYTGRR